MHPVFNPADGLAASVRDVSRFALLHLGDYAAMAPSPPQRFLFCGRDCVVPADDLRAARFDFVRRAGAVAWFRYSRALYPRLSDSASDQGR
jgi:hypothetical protein